MDAPGPPPQPSPGRGGSKTVINRTTATTLYRQIAEQLEAEIRAGAFARDGRLPPERELMTRYGVSRVTVRQAMELLLGDGRIERRQGKGTFVAMPRVQHELNSLRGFYDSLVQQGVQPQTQLLGFAPIAARGGKLDDPFAHEQRGPGFLLRRRYDVKRVAIALVEARLLPEAAGISWQQANAHPIYGILEQLLGLKVAHSRMRIRVQPIDAATAEALGLPRRSPVLVMVRESFDAAGRLLEHTRFFIRPEHYEFVFQTAGPLPLSSSIRDAGKPVAR